LSGTTDELYMPDAPNPFKANVQLLIGELYGW